jgi:hypothetical protein
MSPVSNLLAKLLVLVHYIPGTPLAPRKSEQARSEGKHAMITRNTYMNYDANIFNAMYVSQVTGAI